MRLYLSSQNVGNYATKLIELVGSNRSVAYIGNAKDNWLPKERIAKTEEHREIFESLGFTFHEFDLRDYFGKKQELARDFHGYGLVWLSGGNTFLLRRALKDSGLDNLILNQIGRDKIVFGGSSAGSIIATPSLHGTEFGDDPSQVEKVYGGGVIWEGLDLVPFYIVPHYQSDWFGKESDDMVKYLESTSLPYKTLSDGQVILVDGNREELLA